MKIRYFPDTDTLHIEFKDIPVVGAITVEHASERAGIPEFSCEEVTA